MFRKSLVVALLGLVCANLTKAQLDSGSNGSDGALSLVTPGEVVFDPILLGFDTDRDNIYHFTEINIGPGVVVKMSSGPLQGLPVVWLASGAVQIDGAIELDGKGGHAVNEFILANRAPSEPGPGGFPGGAGMTAGASASNPQPGSGPGGGFPRGCGAGYAFPVLCQFSGTASSYGNALVVPLLGGSGGGGGLTTAEFTVAGGGGAGGGALRIFSSTSITLNGSISANGGDGGGGTNNGGINGGGGSGGGIHLIAPTIGGSGSLFALGGGATDDFVNDGSVGRIRLDATEQNFTGASDPPASLGTPFNVPLPGGFPQIRVTSIGGELVPASPTGSFTMPDVSINEANALPVEIEARNIPLGTVAQVHVFSEAGPDQTIDSTPLVGTLALSTATADVTFPPGFSRGFVRATWSPPSP